MVRVWGMVIGIGLGHKMENPKFLVTIGNMAHFVTEENVHLPAIVVKVWDDAVVNLTVFIDHENYTGDPSFARTKVPYSEEGAKNSWHFPEMLDLSAYMRKREE